MFSLSFLFAVLILMVNFPLDVFAKVRCTQTQKTQKKAIDENVGRGGQLIVTRPPAATVRIGTPQPPDTTSLKPNLVIPGNTRLDLKKKQKMV